MKTQKTTWLMACVISGLVFANLVAPPVAQAQGVEQIWQIPSSAAPVVDLLVGPTYWRGQTVYILTETDLYRSTDSGDSWSQLTAGSEEMAGFGEVTFRSGAIAETTSPDSSSTDSSIMRAEVSGVSEQGHNLWIVDSSGGVWTVDAATTGWIPLASGAPAAGLQPALVGPLPPSAHFSATELAITAQQEIVVESLTQFMELSPAGERLLVVPKLGTLCFLDTVTLQELGCADLPETNKFIDHERITWSPDQRKLALTEDSSYDESDIWVLDIATGEFINLTDDGVTGKIADGDAVDYMPLWSLDGEEIYFARTIAGPDQSTDLYAIAADGGEPRKVFTLADSSFALQDTMHWAHDGSGLYFSRLLPQLDDPTNGVWYYDTVNHSLRQLLGPDEESGIPTVRAVNTATGKALIHYLDRTNQYATTYFLLDLATEELSELLPVLEQDDMAPIVMGATLSPDGSKVLYSYSDSDSLENFHVVVRDVDGGEDNVLMSATERLGVSRTFGKELSWANDDTVTIGVVNDGILVKLAAE